MPLYEYECLECAQRTEIIQRFDDPPLPACPECSGAVRRLISAPAVQFKGSGWYVTDYAGKKPAAPGAAKEKDAESAASSPSEGGSKPARQKKAVAGDASE